jgi:poly-gamma-glutamate system protein
VRTLYWRPRRVSRPLLALLALASLLGLAALERTPQRSAHPHREAMLAAARGAERALVALRDARRERGLAVDPATDPQGTGLIGLALSPITSNHGSLRAKQLSVNPEFAALVVEHLLRAGVRRGDAVAVAWSGSFPALNVCVLAALETLALEPVIITSASASQWGANQPDLTWLHMERILFERGLFSRRSVAASVGGIEDRGLGLEDEGRALLERVIREQGLALLAPRSLAEAIELRMRTYAAHAGGRAYRALVNVGGGTAALGRKATRVPLVPGLNTDAPPPGAPDSVVARFLEDGVPVLHLAHVERLAEAHGLSPPSGHRAPLGEGKLFARPIYDRRLAAVLLLVIVVALHLLSRSDLGIRRRPSEPSA